MTDEKVDLLLEKIENLTDALNLNMGIPTDMTDEERAALMANKKEAAILNAEIQLLYAQKELEQLKK